MECAEGTMMGKCDMSKCAEMTKEECASMCDSLKCTPEQKEMCLANYDADGKFIASEGKMDCCANKDAAKIVKVEVTNVNGNAKATVITSEKGDTNVQVFEGSLEEVKAKVEALK